MSAAGWQRRAVLLAAALVLAGCASPPKPTGPASAESGPWSGRLAMEVEGRETQSFSAGFQLQGDASAGELTLFNPLGGVLAELAWAPGKATLRSNGETRQFSSVGALVTQATGSDIPLTALFDWLRGRDTPVPGWKADLAQLADGRLRAKRLAPQPLIDMRLVLER